MKPLNWTARLAAVVVSLGLVANAAQAQLIDVTAPGNPIVGVAATLGANTSSLAVVGTTPNFNNYPAAESPPNSIDNLLSNKYLNFMRTGAGFIVTPNAASVLAGVHFATGNDAPERDPLTVTIEGTNDPNPTSTLDSLWTLIYTGPSGLATDPGRNTFGAETPFVNALSFTSYRVLVSSVRNNATANSFQFAEIELLAAVPEPSSLALAAIGIPWVVRRWRRCRSI